MGVQSIRCALPCWARAEEKTDKMLSSRYQDRNCFSGSHCALGWHSRVEWHSCI